MHVLAVQVAGTDTIVEENGAYGAISPLVVKEVGKVAQLEKLTYEVTTAASIQLDRVFKVEWGRDCVCKVARMLVGEGGAHHRLGGTCMHCLQPVGVPRQLPVLCGSARICEQMEQRQV